MKSLVAASVTLVIFLNASIGVGVHVTPSDADLVLEESAPASTHSSQQWAGLPSFDPGGMHINGALAKHGVVSRNVWGGGGVPEDETAGLRARLAREGIDFYARGNEPSWALDVDLDSVMHFMTGGELRLSFPAVEGVKAQDTEALRFHAETGDGSLTITITRGRCVDTMSGEEFTHTVSVELRTSRDPEFKRFEGCGRYLPDPRLAKGWTLEELNGKAVSAEGLLKGLPRLEFFAEEGRIGGHGGCNSITGIYINEWKVLQFGQIAHTLMACPEMAVEQKFLAVISGRSFRYDLRDQELILSGPDGTTLRFQAAVD